MQAVRVAMWSGPRNLSTALLRSFENRSDTAVTDEPFYACYLAATGLDHPMRDEVLRSQPTSFGEVAAALTGPVPGDRRVHYQKHMTHHVLPGMDLGWLDEVTSAFLVRDPREVVASYAQKRERVTLADLGAPQALALFQRVRERTGRVPPVLDARDVLADPRRLLALLCDAVGIPFEERMLAWPPGPRATDGVWAPHWYASVERSTGFSRPSPAAIDLPPELEAIAAEAEPFHRELWRHRLGA